MGCHLADSCWIKLRSPAPSFVIHTRSKAPSGCGRTQGNSRPCAVCRTGVARRGAAPQAQRVHSSPRQRDPGTVSATVEFLVVGKALGALRMRRDTHPATGDLPHARAGIEHEVYVAAQQIRQCRCAAPGHVVRGDARQRAPEGRADKWLTKMYRRPPNHS